MLNISSAGKFLQSPDQKREIKKYCRMLRPSVIPVKRDNEMKMKLKYPLFPEGSREKSTFSPEFFFEKAVFGDQHSRHCYKRGWLYLFLVCIVVFYPLSALSSDDEAGLWKAMRAGEAIVLLRHALAPGTGDPADFEVEDCSTQRNLSDAGRRQAESIGNMFRQHGIEKARVLSSQWCRCLETARLLKLGPVEEMPHLNSFFRRYERRDLQTQKLRAWISRQNLDQPVVLVTHQVNITSLTEVYPSSGEMVIVSRLKSGEISVLGTIKTD